MQDQSNANNSLNIFKILGLAVLASTSVVFVKKPVMALELVKVAFQHENFSYLKNSDNEIPIFPRLLASQPRNAKDYFDRGLVDLKNGNYDQAIANFTQALKLKPDYYEVLFQRGLAYLKVEAYREAFYDFDAFLEIYPNNVEALFHRGKALLYRGTAYYREAIVDFTQVIKLKPNYADAYLYRAAASSSDHRYINYGRAIADINQFLQLKQAIPEIKQEIAWAYGIRGMTYSGIKDHDKAISDLSQALKLDPNLLGAYFYRGSAYYKKGEFQQAIADYTQLLQLSPQYPLVLSARAEAYLGLEDYDRAISDYTQDLKKMGFENPRTYYDRGVAYAMKGDRKNAIKDFTKVLELTKDPDFPGYTTNLELHQKAKQQLQKLGVDIGIGKVFKRLFTNV